ncbi:MAG: hypothetical protein EBR10_11300, partial [Planctomycetes bacterium]|nr:hypothetical protein [Planctomycetota bacterium]
VLTNSRDGAEQAHHLDSMSAPDLAESSSDCWTRTSDPVINRPRSHSENAAEVKQDVPQVLIGLARAVRVVDAEMAALERWEAEAS